MLAPKPKDIKAAVILIIDRIIKISVAKSSLDITPKIKTNAIIVKLTTNLDKTVTLKKTEIILFKNIVPHLFNFLFYR